MKHFFKVSLVFLFTAFFSACEEKDPPLPDNLLQFESAEQVLDTSQKELTIKLKLSRAVDVATKVVIKPTFDGVTYGNEVTTTPAVASDVITVTIPAAASEGSFTLARKDDVFLTGSESVTFAIQQIDAPVLVGTIPSLKVSFSTIVSEGTTIQLDGGAGGANAANSVFVDLSNNAQTAVARSSWDFGFSSGSEFNVILNHFIATTAVATEKTDINTVGAADTVGVGLILTTSGSGQLALVDDIGGDLTKTVIKPVSATDADNKVYIVRRGTGGGVAAKDLIKVRVLRNGSNYTLQYAKLTETTFKSVTINKQPTHNFAYFSIETEKTVDVEPAKASWDFVWSGAINQASFGAGLIPYYFSDLVFTNIYGGTQVAEVKTSVVSYDNYAEVNIASTAFKSGGEARLEIGANWRATTGTIGVYNDRFYVVKDAAGNVYKVKFVNFHSADGGERGKPTITYKLVKKG